MSGEATPMTEVQLKVRARKNITWLLLFAIVMFFAALSSAYIVSKASIDYWVTFRIPTAFYYSTATIIASSLTVQMALWLVRKGRAKASALWLVVTLIFGLSFSFTQFSGWTHLIGRGYYLTEKVLTSGGTYGEDFTITRKGITLEKVGDQYFLPTDAARAKPLNAEMEEFRNTASSYFYVITFGHWMHLAGGLIALLVLVPRALMGRYGAENHTGIWQGAMYWHFLGGLWIYLLLFLTVVH